MHSKWTKKSVRICRPHKKESKASSFFNWRLERIRRLLPDPELQAQKPSAVKKARRAEAFDKERVKNRLRLKMNLPFCQSLSGEVSNE